MDMLYYEGKEICPFCKHKFNTMKMRASKTVVISQDYDFCQHFEDNHNPMFYDVSVCPKCSYAYTKNTKKPYEPYYSLVKANYIDKVTAPMQLCEKRSIDQAIVSYKLLYLVSVELKDKKTTLGNIALKIAWLYRYKKDLENEMKYLEHAARFLEEGFSSENSGGNDERTILILAEINLKLNNYEASRKLLSNLITGKTTSAKFKKLAVDRWQDYKEQMERENAENII